MSTEVEGENGNLYSAEFLHIYRVNGFFKPTSNRHECLINGFWCWSNAARYPQDIIKYFRKKVIK